MPKILKNNKVTSALKLQYEGDFLLNGHIFLTLCVFVIQGSFLCYYTGISSFFDIKLESDNRLRFLVCLWLWSSLGAAAQSLQSPIIWSWRSSLVITPFFVFVERDMKKVPELKPSQASSSSCWASSHCEKKLTRVITFPRDVTQISRNVKIK